MTGGLLRRPSALIPIVMSMIALAIVLGYAAVFGVPRQADQGTAAHLWQLLIAGQLPGVAFFLIRWMSRQPGQALLVLAVQLAAPRRDLPSVVVALVTEFRSESRTADCELFADRSPSASISGLVRTRPLMVKLDLIEPTTSAS